VSERLHPAERIPHRDRGDAGPAIRLVGLWVEAGGRHETPEQNGIAHFLEHMAFKGTRRRSALRIAEEIEDVGGYINAYTSREMTAYYARVLSGDVLMALDVIADIVLNPCSARRISRRNAM
jgi:predicted Zn-dependent peptidase